MLFESEKPIQPEIRPSSLKFYSSASNEILHPVARLPSLSSDSPA
jgi:hypothetical protein